MNVIDQQVEQYQDSSRRMLAFIEASGINQAKIASLTGIHAGTISRISSGKQVLGDDVINKLVAVFDVNAEWLKYGNGLMGSAKQRPNSKPKYRQTHINEAVPLSFVDETEVTTNQYGIEFRELDNDMVLVTMSLVPEIAYASYPQGWKDPEYLVELPRYSIVLPKGETGLFRAFEVRGDSMDDGSKYSISHGDVAIGRNIDIDLWDVKLHANGGTDYIIVTHDGIIIKRVIDHDLKEGVITCASKNPNKNEFPDFSIRLSEVYELYKVRKIDRDWNRR